MFPEFDGRVAYGWIITVEQYCEAKGISEVKKFSAAKKALTRDALLWWNDWKRRNQRATWMDFVIALLRKFEPDSDLFLPDPVQDTGEEEKQTDETRKAKATNLELRRNWCEEWVKFRCTGDERFEGDRISENEETEEDLTENIIVAMEEMTIAAKLQICDTLQESRGEAAGVMLSVKQPPPPEMINQEEKKIEQVPPDQSYRGADAAALTSATPMFITRTRSVYDQRLYTLQATESGLANLPPPQPPDKSCHAVVEETLRGAKWKQTQKHPPPKPPEYLDCGGNPAAYATTPAPARSEDKATPATRMREKIAEVSRRLKASAWAKWVKQELDPSLSIMGLAQRDSRCVATGA
ncbi:uncharacterized protein LOC130726834 isoform X2 [Lotus japonicus]|uniref:uncharacterized protein LOC130726834 isoform X2 n=1 Tax=Lotus japonicus TaxID=34305 RepID=UPI002583F8D3|nr:uncharacterized protein LOC130726834 isoform X2 [Lotus japonicus]